MDECVFCKIVSKEIPNHTIYEDEKVLAFLDIQPITEGHVVVVSKEHAETVWQLNDETYAHLMKIGKRIANHTKKSLDAFRVGLIIEGLEVDHSYLKIFPISEGMRRTLNDQNFGDVSQEELEKIAKKLKLQ